MQKGKSTHIIKGMNKDMSAATMNSEFAFDAKNIRITPIDEGGLLVVTNEKGNIEIPIVNITRENMVIEGNILGTQILNNYVIIFTHNEDFDRIYRLEKKEDTFEGLLLYQGNLNFSNDNPIEGLAVYENEEVQKVYWIDGRNQARVINFVVPEEKRNTWIDTSFDFIPELRLEEEVTTSINIPGNGSFHSGVIQYAFTYYNKYGQESNIFYTTSLISIPTEGASPEDIIGCTINIKINYIDKNFDYLRVYSIHRTSLNATPEVRLVKDINIKENIRASSETEYISFSDNGRIGSTIDATELLYKGGESIIPETLTQKDNTLFLGNIKLNNTDLNINIESYFDLDDIEFITYTDNTYRKFKSNETYSVGFQIQYKNGKWSNVYYLKEVTNNYKPNQQVVLSVPLKQSFKDYLKNNGYKKIRIATGFKDKNSRDILAQGIIMPTIFNIVDRKNDINLSQPAWRVPDTNSFHGKSLPANNYDNAVTNYLKNYDIDIQSLINEVNITETISGEYNNTNFCYDFNIVDFYSPDIEFSDLSSIDLTSYKLRILGITTFYRGNSFEECDIQSSNPSIGEGYYLTSWEDVGDSSTPKDTINYKIYLWQNSYLTQHREDFEVDGTTYFANKILDKKIIIQKDCTTTASKTIYFDEPLTKLGYFTLYKEDEQFSTIKQYGNSNSNNDVNAYRIYLGNIDKIITTDEEYKIATTIGLHSLKGGFTDPILMKYSSTNHIVLNIKRDAYGTYGILPYIVFNNKEVYKYPNSKFRDISSVSTQLNIFQEYFTVNEEVDEKDYVLYIAELYKEHVKDDLNIILWNPGKSYNLSKVYNISSIEGDSYYDSYECLTVFSPELENVNGVSSLITFKCESFCNFKGVYNVNNNKFIITPDTFRKYNNVYNQDNNFFSNRVIENSSINKFPNTITWTKEKQAGADVDTWTNITMASTLDLDGDKGAITSLNTFNNEIYAFQERGLSNILFNSRVQVSTSDGVPIEISNGYKVQGKRYVSNSIGCNNKWSITESPNGIYFIDSDTNSLYLFNGTINSLSDRFGLRGWLSNNNSNKEWNTVTYENFRSFYDRNNGDVYFIKDDDCLCFSELLGQFISFYDYTRVPSMFNVEGDLFSIKNNKLWKHYSTDNTSIYGEDKEYYITLLSNTDPLKDKIFSNIVCRADGSDNTFFNKLEVWNEYQKGESDLTNIINKPSNLKQKFRTWRVNIPRDNTHKLDRMRNPWLYIKLIGKENNIKLYGTEVEFFM